MIPRQMQGVFLLKLTTPPCVSALRNQEKGVMGSTMMVKDVQHGKTTRKSFARIDEILEMPNLIEVQKKSYQWFLTDGLREVFEDVASISD